MHSQEKRTFLQHRFDGYKMILTKDHSTTKLTAIKHKLESIGVLFTFTNVKRNRKKEIIGAVFTIRNKKSNATVRFENGKPIPDILIGEVNDIVFIKPSNKIKTDVKNILHQKN
ncbi:MAG: hypothetical protein HWD85_10155 [Flavobacteriaceae bacterium]|nr:hypothetical protein [Flavobacteriaceae bacterium]